MSQSKPNSAELEVYAREYVSNGGNRSAAWRKAFPKSKASESGAWASACTFHKLPQVQERIAEVEAELIEKSKEKFDVTAEDVLALWWKMATADPREIGRVENTACRHCHGFDHEYQWTDEKEFEKAAQDAERYRGDPVEDWGGYGYSPKLRPVDTCPNCHGEGIQRVWLSDSRDLSEGAALLFDGIKPTRNGIEVKTLSRMDAMVNLVRAMGGFTDNMNHRSPDGSMTPTPTVIERRVIDPGEAGDV